MFESVRSGLSAVVQRVRGARTISEKNVQDVLEEVKTVLLEADVAVRVVRRFVNRTLEEVRGEKVLSSVTPSQMFIKLLHDRLRDTLGNEKTEIPLLGSPAVVAMFGLQGSGKTTTCAKVARHYKNMGKSVSMVAADILRPAAEEQLCILGQNVGCEVHRSKGLGAPIEIVQHAYKRAKSSGDDIIIIDTSGRTELDDVMLREAAAMARVSGQCARILVLDAMAGQTAVEVAQRFHEALELTGLIFTKTDSDARGGALLSAKTVAHVPIHFIGTGEKLDALEVFHPDRIASRMLGMGDVVTLVERAQETIKEKEAERLHKKIIKRNFTLSDYVQQLRQLTTLGSIEEIAQMMPEAQRLSMGKIDEQVLRRQEAIILSMTPRERENERIIGATRRARIARGSGTSVAQVNALLKKFEKTKLTMRKAIKNKKFQQRLLGSAGTQQSWR